MIGVEDHWETVDNLRDVSIIIREYYNPELANELDKLIDEVEMSKVQSQRLEELEEMIEDIRRIVW